MPALVPPSHHVRDSYLRAVAEYRSEGRRRYLKPRYDAALAGEFDRHLEDLARDATECPGRETQVPQTTLWWVDGAEFLGTVRIRHRLTDELRRSGGHLGYDLRPAARGRGHGTPMVAAALRAAAALGIECALLTVDAANTPSRRIIERVGGLRWQADGDRLRFWVPTHVAPA
ncbi:GNAT family N-acetyltransferase [Catellatospora sp. NPDC049609]|uniref:GNAT family N-acetyltransferase n=1 Tax=Catellatospora sp. NPDC049609 TaxID=3155505 RepID=UPI00341E161C